MTTQSSAVPKTKNLLPLVLFTIFLDMLGIGILIPVIPLLLADAASPYYLLSGSMSAGRGYVLMGFLIASFSFSQFLAAPVLGQLSDRYGRRKILIVSLAGTCLSYVLFAWAILTRNIPLLFGARILDGVTGGNIAVVQASIADITAPEDRTKTFGLIGAAFGLGFIIGPFIGGKLSDPSLVGWFGAATPFWFAALLSFTNMVSVSLFFTETHKDQNPDGNLRWNQSLLNLLKAFNMPGLRVMYTTIFLFHSGFSFFTTFVSVFLITRFGFDQGHIGNFFAYVGIWIIITQALITRRVSRWLTEPQVLRFSLVACGLGVLSYFLPTASWQLLLVAPCFAIFNGLSQANIAGLMSRSVDGSIQGEILGVNSSIQAFAQSIPPVLAGLLASNLSPRFPVLVSGCTIITAGLVFLVLYRAKVVPVSK